MSLHIGAKEGDFAKVVLMPGDPKRSEWIAKTFLKDAVLINDVRGMNAYTGYLPSGEKVSIMPSGMGTPSTSIYVTELIESYGVDVIIRVGTIGSYAEDIKLKDLIVAQGACSDANGIENFIGLGCSYSAIGDYELINLAAKNSKKSRMACHVGNVLSSNVFYNPNPNAWKVWQSLGVLGVEMETYALYCIAAGHRKKALSICTVSDSFVYPEKLSAKERQESLTDMIEVALGVAEDYYKAHKAQ